MYLPVSACWWESRVCLAKSEWYLIDILGWKPITAKYTNFSRDFLPIICFFQKPLFMHFWERGATFALYHKWEEIQALATVGFQSVLSIKARLIWTGSRALGGVMVNFEAQGFGSSLSRCTYPIATPH